jgi:hypothetical protein
MDEISSKKEMNTEMAAKRADVDKWTTQNTKRWIAIVVAATKECQSK